MGNKSGLRIAAAFLLILTSATSAGAQSNQTENTINALGNLFGALAQASAKSKVLKQWQAQDAQVIQCINTIYSSKNITADSFVAAGVGPNDQRVAPVITLCKAVMIAQPKTNFPCNVTNSSGQQVTSTCSESYSVSRNGSLVAVSRDDFLRAVGNGEQVQVANFETADGEAARIQAEKQQAEAERQQDEAYWASADGIRLWAAITKMKKETECHLPSVTEGGRINQEAYRRYEIAVGECNFRYYNIKFTSEMMDRGYGWFIGIIDWKNGGSKDRMVDIYNTNQNLHDIPIRIFEYQDASGIYIGPFPTRDAADNYHIANGTQLGFSRQVNKTVNNLNWRGFNLVWTNGVDWRRLPN